MFARIFDDAPERARGKVVGLYGILVAANIGAWLWAVAAFHGNAFLLGTAFLAYSFGLRHAFDADHIAAIDNITRKLMQEGRRPLAVGFFFSLGHATIVVALVLIIAPVSAAAQQHFTALKEVGGVIATAISAAFLFAIAAANIAVLMQTRGALLAFRKNGRVATANTDHGFVQGGLIGRLLRPLFALITRSWHAYPLGLLFGLGFDTATEVGLLGVSAGQAAHGLSIATILVFPALFTAGMSLMDTADSSIMVGTYGWAFVNPIRKLHYNLTVTFASVVAALVIGGIEALSLIGNTFALEGPVWRLTASLSDNLGLVGYLLVAFFIVCWLASYLLYKLNGYDDMRISVKPRGRSF
jgi:nickel/cobalt transporter (NiCoT) family protein